MSVTISERPDSTDSVDGNLIRNVTRNYDMTSTSRMSAVAASLAFSNATGVLINSIHPDLSTLYCSTIGATENPNSAEPFHHYSVSATYTNSFDSGGEGTSGGGGSAGGATAGQQQGVPPNERQATPTLRQVDVKVSGQTMQVSMRVDANGKTYNNTAGDPISPAPTRAVPTVKITIGRNYSICPGNMFQHLGKINNKAVIIPIANLAYPVFGLRFATLDAEPVFEAGFTYWRVNCTLEQGPNKVYRNTINEYTGWITPLASMGRRGKTRIGDPAGRDVPVHVITDGEKARNETVTPTGTGQPLAEPIFLDRDGYYIKPGDKAEFIHYMDFQPDEAFSMEELWL